MADLVMQRVRVLFDRGVTRIDELEVLLAMARRSGRAWTAREVAESALLSDERVLQALAGLEVIGLIRRTLGEPDGPRFSSSADLDLAGLQMLRSIHAVDRSRIANTFFACKLEALRDGTGKLRRGRPA